jgi:hypothetical protein
MSELETISQLESELADAHAQLIDRDQRITDLAHENAALRTHLESVLRTRAWRMAERFRTARATVLRRSA